MLLKGSSILIFSLLQLSVNAQTSTVHILTWSDYFKNDAITQKIEKQCGAQIDFQTFDSSSEFLSKKQKENYDLYVFSDTIYHQVKDEIPRIKSDLWKQSEQYNPIIKSHYLSQKFPQNVVYFMHSLTGFLWNPSVVNLSQKDSVREIFRKAKTNSVVLLDDPVEVAQLVHVALDQKSDQPFSSKSFGQVIGKVKVTFANDKSQVYENKNFAFAFVWSGSAIENSVRSQKDYKFLLYPKLSYISSDVLAQLNDNPVVACVAKHLTDKSTLDEIQNRSYYFSPYADKQTVTEPKFLAVYESFLNELPHLQWNDGITKKTLLSDEKVWKEIRTKY